MLEWYEAYADYDEIMGRSSVCVAPPPPTAVVYDGELDLSPPWRRQTLRDAILRGDRRRRPRASRRRRRWRRRRRARLESERGGPGRSSSTTCSRRSWSRRSSSRVHHGLPGGALAVREARPHRGGLVERFEAFCGGMEIANAFSELNDPPSSASASRRRLATQGAGDDEASRTTRSSWRRSSRHAADGRARPGHRPADDGADRHDKIRDVVLFPALRDPPAS